MVEKSDDSDKAISELESTNEIKIISNEEDEKITRMLVRTEKREDLIRKLKYHGYSEFIIGTIIGYTLANEEKLTTKKKMWIPQIFRK